MPFKLTCDSCAYADELAEEVDTYAAAKEHEERYPDHFVFIEQNTH